MSIVEIITDFVVFYCAGLAKYIFIVQQREKRYRVKVKLRLGFIVVISSGAKDVVVI